MNKQRRKAVAEVQDLIRQAHAILISAGEKVEIIKDEEESYDNMPEGIQAGERGEKAQEAINNLDSTKDLLETIDSEIDDLLEQLESAAE